MKYVMAFMFLVVTAGIPVLAYDLTREGKSAPQIAPQPPAIRLTMLGDSIIAMMAPQQPSLPPPVNSAVNLGVGGQNTTSIKKQVASIPATTTHVLLEGGINNYFLGTSASILTDYAAMLDAIPASMRVVVLGITQSTNPPTALNTKFGKRCFPMHKSLTQISRLTPCARAIAIALWRPKRKT